jgi:uncharacterized membrane protein YeiB
MWTISQQSESSPSMFCAASPCQAACRLLQSHGRLALTHYLTQTVFGIALLPVIIAAHPLNAFEVLCLCIAICAGQIAFSPL